MFVILAVSLRGVVLRSQPARCLAGFERPAELVENLDNVSAISSGGRRSSASDRNGSPSGAPPAVGVRALLGCSSVEKFLSLDPILDRLVDERLAIDRR